MEIENKEPKKEEEETVKGESVGKNENATETKKMTILDDGVIALQYGISTSLTSFHCLAIAILISLYFHLWFKYKAFDMYTYVGKTRV